MQGEHTLYTIANASHTSLQINPPQLRGIRDPQTHRTQLGGTQTFKPA